MNALRAMLPCLLLTVLCELTVVLISCLLKTWAICLVVTSWMVSGKPT